jgi:hypothetical protein
MRTPKGKTSVYVEKFWQDKDSQWPLKIDEYQNSRMFYRTPDEKDPLIVVMGNGAFASSRSLGRFVAEMVRAATEDERAISVIVHHDPFLGDMQLGTAYAPQERVRRFGRAMMYAADRYDQPLQMVGHSWSWPAATALTARLHGTGSIEVATLTGYTPTHEVSPSTKTTPWSLLKSSAKEGWHFLRTAPTPAIAGQLLGSALTRLATAPGTLLREARQTFQPGNTNRDLTAISQRGATRIGLLLAEDDAFYPPFDALGRLSGEAGEPIGSKSRVMPNTTHLSAVADYRHGADLYHFIAEQDADYRLAKAALGQTALRQSLAA